jgi:hypothetical protein
MRFGKGLISCAEPDTPIFEVLNEGPIFVLVSLALGTECLIARNAIRGILVERPIRIVAKDNTEDLLALLAIMNSVTFRALVNLQMAFGSFEVGVIQRTPIPPLAPTESNTLATLAHRVWSLKRALDSCTETSHAFYLPALIQVGFDTVQLHAAARAQRTSTIGVQLSMIQDEVDHRCFELYGLDSADRSSLAESFAGSNGTSGSADTDSTDDEELDEDGDNEVQADAEGLAADLVSWGVGVSFGRFDVRLATGTRPVPVEPKPFDALPVCSPAMFTGNDGVPLATVPLGYPIQFPESGILVDDPGHPRDLTATVRVVFDEVFGGKAAAWWNDVATLLDPEKHELNTWLKRSFFDHHLKHHSKSRRNAPILWQLSVTSGEYSIWIYAHRLTRDSLFGIHEMLVLKIKHEEQQLISLGRDVGPNPTAKERKDIATQETLIDELRAFLGEIKRVAPLWNPNLDDGVVLTMAPLWRLVPQHKPWQKELKSKWDELAMGKYDWAHIAMHLWPERVVPKCATDRSLAIAHDLEEVFWIQGDDGKWKPRPTPTRPMDQLIAERSSSAVKAALKAFLQAPNSAPASRSRRKNAEGVAL